MIADKRVWRRLTVFFQLPEEKAACYFDQLLGDFENFARVKPGTVFGGAFRGTVSRAGLFKEFGRAAMAQREQEWACAISLTRPKIIRWNASYNSQHCQTLVSLMQAS